MKTTRSDSLKPILNQYKSPRLGVGMSMTQHPCRIKIVGAGLSDDIATVETLTNQHHVYALE